MRIVRKVAVVAVVAIGHWYWTQHEANKAYDAGMLYMEQWVAACELDDAHAGKCFIPCHSDSDCVAKNGVEEY